MKLLVDLFTCQTASRFQDIGRFALSLTREMAIQRQNNQMYALADVLYPEPFEELRQEFIRLLPAGFFLPYHHEPLRVDSGLEIEPYVQIATTLVQQAYQVISPDVVLTLNPFEGWGEKGVVPPPIDQNPSYHQVAILHDRMPLVSHEQNLDHNPEYRKWYLAKLNLLSRYNRLLTTSESTRQNAIEQLGIEPERVVNITGVLDSPFQASDYPENEIQNHWEMSAHLAWTAIEALAKERNHRFVVSTAGLNHRDRIAYVSPLPPQNSGISKYSADLLPYLANHFDIDLFVDSGLRVSDPDLCRNFSIYPWIKLIHERECYRTVVYHHGNSRFHLHMFELERQFPGVVVLHDFFLSNLLAYIGHPRKIFKNAMDDSHGLRGMVDYRRKKKDVVWDWPINWTVLRYARELVVHSNFQQALLDRYYSRGWKPSLNIIKQLQPLPPVVTEIQRLSARNKLEIEKDQFLLCAFGWVTRPKKGETIIRAFHLASQELGNDSSLIFVGDCSKIEYLNELLDLIQNLDLENRVRFTGYVKEEDYKNYLISANAAVQLRKDTRGETSRAVLDCMAYGLATIINSHGTLNDYSEDDVVKIPDPVKVEELARVMIRLRNDHAFRLEKGQRARKVIAEQHDPETIASAYAEVINRAIQKDDRLLFSPLLDALRGLNNPPQLVKSQATWAARNFTFRSQTRIIIDVSVVAFEDLRSGIQRVVKSMVREFFSMDNPSLRLEIVRLRKGRLIRASRATERILDLPNRSLGPEKPLTIQPGDTLLLLDSNWRMYDQFLPIFECIRMNGGKILTLIYDLLPIRHPDKFPPNMPEVFHKYIRSVISQSDVIVGISRSTAEDINDYISEHKITPTHRLDVTNIHLGADFSVDHKESRIRKLAKELEKQQASPLFLMVGTVEPRKGIDFCLDAFEILWEQGFNGRLCVAGSVGWGMENTVSRLGNHPEQGNRLLILENPSDAEIDRCYAVSTALIAASLGEGFGLPLVEAAFRQLPVIASDIPVFHEVCGEGAMYFSLESPSNLAAAIHRMMGLEEEQRISLVSKIPLLTWKESATWLLDVLDGNLLRR